MHARLSPLRYPGGKGSLQSLVSNILNLNQLKPDHYVEPYAGGGSLALAMLFGGHVRSIHLNDLDSAIWNFWHSLLHQTEDFVALIKQTPITIEEWHRQRAVQKSPDNHTRLQRGFATFFLNRTNRSGIIKKAGVIGGLAQNGPYKLDCRFNKANLIHRIERIAKYKSRIHVSGEDATDFLQRKQWRNMKSVFFFIDPPYIAKGASLYTNHYEPDDHAKVAKVIRRLAHPWLVTYDCAPQIADYYAGQKLASYAINYSANIKRKGKEFLIASKHLGLPSCLETESRAIERNSINKHLALQDGTP